MAELVSNSVRIVVIGASEPSAVRRVLEALPPQPGFAAIVSCPKLDPKQLQATTKLSIVPVSSTAEIQPDRVFVLGQGMPRYKGGQLVVDLSETTPAPVDAILRSVADEAGRFGVGILLGSTGSDGVLGMKRMKESGGLTIVEKVDGASNGHAGNGLIDLVLPIDDIARQLVAFVRSDEQRLLADDDPRDGGTDTLRDVLALVRMRAGHDFGSYKRATLSRRIARRMQVNAVSTVVEYHDFLRDHPGELNHLLRDFLISVTNFFRDPDAFLALEAEVVPRLFANKSAKDQLRVWVAGCATGEEAYSIAMLLLEHAARLRAPPEILIFATDIDEVALAEARLGCYPETIAADVSPERLERFFTRENAQYRVCKELREVVMFSTHNLLRDPPFSRLDLISCRNLLIYLNRDAQNRLLTVFHFGLRPDALLFLGSSESAENSHMFGAIDPKHRVFVRNPATLSLGDTISSAGRWTPTVAPAPPAARATPVGELHHRIVEHYAPPSVLVNSELDILHLSEHAGRYLVLSGGEPTRQLLRLAHPALSLDLRTALHAARQSGSETRVVRFEDHGVARAVEMRVRSVAIPELGHGSFLVMFDELSPDGRAPSSPAGASMEPIVRDLEDELHRTRDHLRTTVEQYETSLEELKASNEELQAINEELRSATEELETSKEELQSVNEELSALNHELKVNVDDLSHANSDLQNLMSSTDIGVLFLDRGLNIKRFTPRVRDLFNVIPSDVGRPLAHVTHRLRGENLTEIATAVLSSLRAVDKEVTTLDGRRYLARCLPYRSLDDRIDGIVLTFVDVTDLRDAVDARKRTQVALDQVEERLRVALLAAPIAVLSYDTSLDLTWAYIAGRLLDVDERGSLPILSSDTSARLAEIVRQASVQKLVRQIELDVLFDGKPRLFEFRIEPTTAGVTAVGFEIDRR